MLLGGMDGCLQSTSMIEYAASAALREHHKLDLPPQGTASMRLHEPLEANEMRTKGGEQDKQRGVLEVCRSEIVSFALVPNIKFSSWTRC
jgi:hypothetical protein